MQSFHHASASRLSILHRMLLGSSAILLVGAAASAHAQTAPAEQADAAPPAAQASEGGLQDIVVTARKRVESVQDVPVSVTAISAVDIQNRDLTTLERLAAATPQLSIGRNATGSGAQLTLRGVGSNSLSIGTEQSIAVIVDGVYYGQGRTINEGFFDLGGIEILKGPQSLFYGKNATAGVISITTQNPTDHLTASLRGGYEFNAQKVSMEGVLSGPISDTLGFRVAVRASKDYGSLFDNLAGPITYNTRDTPTSTTVAPNTPHTAGASADDGPNEREFLTRATLRWEPTDRFSATLKANYGLNKTRPGTWNYAVFACQGGTSTTSPGTPCVRDFAGRVNNMPADIAAETRFARPDGVNFNNYKSWGTTLSMDYALDHLAISSVSNYNWNKNHWSNDIDYQSSPTVNIWGAEVSKYHAFSSELRVLSTFESPVNFLLGGYYQKTKRGFEQVVLNNASENSAAPDGYRYVTYAKDSGTDGETMSLYGQVIWKIVPTIEATGGVRYIHETKDSYFVQPYANPRFANISYRVGQQITADQTFNNWSPEATLTWKPSRDITVYGAYKTAYKSGGFSNSSILTTTTPADFFTFDPERAKGFEGGVKTTLFDRQLRVNVGVYSYKFTDLQVTYLDSAALSYNSVNAGSVRTKGVEMDFEYAPRGIEGFELNGSANYNKARYGSSIAPCYGGQTPANGCFPGLLVAPVAATPTTPARAGTPGQNLNGLPTSDAPLWTLSLGTKYETPVSDGMVAGLSIDSRYSSSYLTSPFGTPLSRQQKYVNLDASIRLRAEDDRWEIALLGKNLTNQFVVTGETDASGSGPGTGTAAGRTADQVGFVSMPRTVAIQLTWRMP
jgi:outer membrane receptor protein involved in Fe transport